MADGPRRWPAAWRRVALDRFVLRRVDGLEFARVLGTGRGADVGPSYDPGRTAVFALWRDEGAYRSFVESNGTFRRWNRATTAWHCELRCVRSTGEWRGVAPIVNARSVDGPVAVLTRARIRRAHWRAFSVAARGTAAALTGTAGLRAVVGIGERPWGTLGTFSVWDSDQAATAFAASESHRSVVEAAQHDGWFTESLFAVFVPVAAHGSWGRCDPLTGDSGVRRGRS